MFMFLAGLPDGQGVFFGDFSLEADKQPSVAGHQCEALFCAVQVGIKGRDEKLNQQTVAPKGKRVCGKGSSMYTTSVYISELNLDFIFIMLALSPGPVPSFSITHCTPIVAD